MSNKERVLLYVREAPEDLLAVLLNTLLSKGVISVDDIVAHMQPEEESV